MAVPLSDCPPEMSELNLSDGFVWHLHLDAETTVTYQSLALGMQKGSDLDRQSGEIYRREKDSKTLVKQIQHVCCCARVFFLLHHPDQRPHWNARTPLSFDAIQKEERIHVVCRCKRGQHGSLCSLWSRGVAQSP